MSQFRRLLIVLGLVGMFGFSGKAAGAEMAAASGVVQKSASNQAASSTAVLLEPIERLDTAPGEALTHLDLLRSPARPEFVLDQDPLFQVRRAIESWRQSWQNGDVDSYLRHYASTFEPGVGSVTDWIVERRRRLARKGLSIGVSALDVLFYGPQERPMVATVTFVQRYTAEGFSDEGIKTLRMRRGAETWLIERESWIVLSSNSDDGGH